MIDLTLEQLEELVAFRIIPKGNGLIGEMHVGGIRFALRTDGNDDNHTRERLRYSALSTLRRLDEALATIRAAKCNNGNNAPLEEA